MVYIPLSVFYVIHITRVFYFLVKKFTIFIFPVPDIRGNPRYKRDECVNICSFSGRTIDFFKNEKLSSKLILCIKELEKFKVFLCRLTV